MPAVLLHGLRAEVASKLNQLETGAAVLERDVRNRRALLAERGFTFPAQHVRHSYWNALGARCRNGLGRTGRAYLAARWWLGWALPHIAFAWRVAQRCAIEGLMCLAAAAVALIPLVAAIIVLAPPE